MSSTKQWFGEFRIYDGGQERYLTPHRANIKLPITNEPFYAELRFLDSNAYFNTIVPNPMYCGNTVEVYLGTSPTNQTLVFRGRIFNIGQEFTGEYKTRSEKYIKCYGYTRDLANVYRHQATQSTVASSIITTLSQELLNRNIIFGFTITPLSDQNIKKIDKDKSYAELLEQVCSEGNWEYYVDHGKTLVAFAKGSKVFSGSIVPDFKADFSWDIENICNSIDVIGSDNYQIGSDLEFTESLSDWSCFEFYDGTVSAGTLFLSTLHTSEISSGTYSVCGSCFNTVALERTFPTTLDLSYGGMISFVLSYQTRWTSEWERLLRTLGYIKTQLEVRAFTDDSNYFATTISLSGGRCITSNYTEYFANDRIYLNIGYNQYGEDDWITVGNPLWESIDRIRFTLAKPFNFDNFIAIDDLRFTRQELRYSALDTISIIKYGVRSREPIRDGNINSYELAQEIATVLLNTFKNPRFRASNVEIDAEKALALPIGHRATIALGNLIATSDIKEIDFDIDGKNVTASCEISDSYAPSFERVFKIIKNMLSKVSYDIESFRKIGQQYALFDTNPDMIGWERMSVDYNLDDETNMYVYNLHDDTNYTRSGAGSLFVGSGFFVFRTSGGYSSVVSDLKYYPFIKTRHREIIKVNTTGTGSWDLYVGAGTFYISEFGMSFYNFIGYLLGYRGGSVCYLIDPDYVEYVEPNITPYTYGTTIATLSLGTEYTIGYTYNTIVSGSTMAYKEMYLNNMTQPIFQRSGTLYASTLEVYSYMTFFGRSSGSGDVRFLSRSGLRWYDASAFV